MVDNSGWRMTPTHPLLILVAPIARTPWLMTLLLCAWDTGSSVLCRSGGWLRSFPCVCNERVDHQNTLLVFHSLWHVLWLKFLPCPGHLDSTRHRVTPCRRGCASHNFAYLQ